jgi:hypothetical protein
MVPTGTRPTVPASTHVVKVSAAGSWRATEQDERERPRSAPDRRETRPARRRRTLLTSRHRWRSSER